MTKSAPRPAEMATIDSLLTHLVDHWHHFEPEHTEEGLRGRVCDLHRYNFLLWHEEDIARSPSVTDGRIAQVKRAMLASQARYAVLEQPSARLRGSAQAHSPAVRELRR